MKISLKKLLVIIGVVLIALSAVIIFPKKSVAPDSDQIIASIRNTISREQANLSVRLAETVGGVRVDQASSGLPIRLVIPKIKVDAAVEHVGLTPQGAMGVPKGPANAAWFELGSRPGEKGSAVIAGHFGWKNGIPAAFDNLSKLRKGDKIYMTDAKGATSTFVVRELRTYGERDDASSVFMSNDGKAHLNLITCEGVWNKAKKSYSSRLVVFTDKL